MRPRSLAAILGFALAFSSGCSAAEQDRPSLQATLTEVEPIITCIFDASPVEEAKSCADFDKLHDANGPAYARDLDDFRSGLITGALGIRLIGAGDGLSPEGYRRAMAYALCIESAAYDHPNIVLKTKKASVRAHAESEVQCKDDVLSPLNPSSVIRADKNADDLPPADITEFFLARLFAANSFLFIQEANGWITDEMRPCVRYAYDRPDSPSCRFHPEPATPPPAPQPFGN